MHQERHVLRTVFGAHLYGTETDASDTDWKKIVVPSAEDILLQRIRKARRESTKTDTAARNTAEDVETEVWSLDHFLDLLRKGDTGALDVLFSPPWAWVGGVDEVWHYIVDRRDKLLSRRVGSFIGYCRNQANKYGIKGSRMAAAEAAADLFAAYSKMIPDVKLRDVEWPKAFDALLAMEHVEIVDKPRPHVNLPPMRHLSVCGRMVPFTFTVKQAAEIYGKLFADYGERARKAKVNEGIDWKALSHAVRVGQEALELLTTGHITFPRPERISLVEIKVGARHYDEVVSLIEDRMERVEKAAAHSPLPDAPDEGLIREILLDAYGVQVDGRFDP